MEEEEHNYSKSDFYFKFDSEEVMPVLLTDFYQQDTEVVVDNETGEETVINVGEPYLVHTTKDYSIDVVGVISEPTGTILTDETGLEYPEVAPLPGWHVNLRLASDNYRSVVEALDEVYGVAPTTPSRVWL